ncbi:cation-independent mannose-6-phosphate receptor isoform X2 [Metopolophium dirhodum]|uniref:cation-independent mannose-6-phosphate receptor isoform X2 n=1 Tax=Metopolophium dirhodum TaxID=44670 RepID=UPI002990797D|nr:cation-independent mannose-6-phosphate receptor isoform X2 [Metopolophium dirhodum]
MVLYNLCLIIAAFAAVIHCEDCIFNLKHNGKDIQFDLNRFKEVQKVNFNKSNDIYLNIKLCKSNEHISTCDGIKSKICLVKYKSTKADIGSKIKEVKLDVKDQLVLSLEGNTICEKNQKYSTDLTFTCNKHMNENKMDFKLNVNHCKYVIELTSALGCPVDDLDIRNVCKVTIPHINFKFNLNPLRRLTINYLVENQNRQFELNICGRLTDNNKCGGNITTICDITDIRNPKVYAVGKYANDQLLYDTDSKSLKLIQHEKATKKKKGRRIEFIFKCDENIAPEKTKPKFLNEENYQDKTIFPNIAYFEVATSAVCIPRIISCEVITKYTARFNLKPLHKRVDNWKIINKNNRGIFYLNICGYLNEYDGQISTTCTVDGKTSACYVDGSGKGISIGSTQIGPYYDGKSIILNYTDGDNCSNSLKWSTVINLTCSSETKLIHETTNFTLCTHAFNWKTPKACEILFERKDQCMVTHPWYSQTVYNISNLKDQTFEKNIEDNASFRFSICGPLQKPCNGILDSAACWSAGETEMNIGLFTEQIVFDNGSIYMSMHGEKCVNNGQGPNSHTIIRFVCDYLDSKWIEYKKDFEECTFQFTISTKYACTQPLKINCTVDDQLGNIFDLSKLTKFNSNYEIITNQKKTIILNVCHSVINNDINGVNCQFNSGVCLVDHNNLLYSNRYKNLGDVKESLQKKGNKIILELMNGFYNNHKVSSVIEFICSNKINGPVLTAEENHKFIFQWFTPLVCPNHQHIKKREIINNYSTLKPTYIQIDGLNYTIYICPKNNDYVNFNSEICLNNKSSHGRTIILSVNKQNKIYTLQNKLYFDHKTNIVCDVNRNTTVQIRFMFYCGYKLQIPKVAKNNCTTNVLSINPEICDDKLECNAGLYDLTPIKGTHIVNINERKYYINICIPGAEGIGGIMELNNITYNIGYQLTPFKTNEVETVEMSFTYGDSCFESRLKFPNTKYSTTMKFICDITENEGNPIFKDSKSNCTLHFEWKTSLVCSRKLVEFDRDKCVATVKISSQNVINNITNDLNNILSVNNLIDDSTKTNYQIDFCNGSVSLNGSTFFGNMNLEYDIFKKQLIANFQNTNDKYFTNVEIIVACTKSTEKLSTFQVISTNNGVRITTYSKGVCCMDFDDYTYEDMCKTYQLISISTTKTVENQLSMGSENNKSIETNIKINLEFTKIEGTYLSVTEQIEESVTLVENYDTTLQQFYGKDVIFDNFTDVSIIKKKEVSGTSFYTVIVLMVLVLLPLIWIYRSKLLKEIKTISYTLPFVSH